MGKRVESSTGRGSVAPQTPPARLRIWLVGGGEGGGRKVIRLEGKERSMHRDVICEGTRGDGRSQGEEKREEMKACKEGRRAGR